MCALVPRLLRDCAHPGVPLHRGAGGDASECRAVSAGAAGVAARRVGDVRGAAEKAAEKRALPGELPLAVHQPGDARGRGEDVGNGNGVKCSIVGEDNRIKDEERMRKLLCEAYALYKGVSRAKAEVFVDLHFKWAVQEYTRTFVLSGCACLFESSLLISYTKSTRNNRF